MIHENILIPQKKKFQIYSLISLYYLHISFSGRGEQLICILFSTGRRHAVAAELIELIDHKKHSGIVSAIGGRLQGDESRACRLCP